MLDKNYVLDFSSYLHINVIPTTNHVQAIINIYTIKSESLVKLCP